MDCCFKSYQEYEAASNEIQTIQALEHSQNFFADMHNYITENIIELPYAVEVFTEKKVNSEGFFQKIWNFIKKCWKTIVGFFEKIVNLLTGISKSLNNISNKVDNLSKVYEKGINLNNANEVANKIDPKSSATVTDLAVADTKKELPQNKLKSDLNEVVDNLGKELTEKGHKDKIVNPTVTRIMNTLAIDIHQKAMITSLIEGEHLVNLLNTLGNSQISEQDAAKLDSAASSYTQAINGWANNLKNSPFGDMNNNFLVINKDSQQAYESAKDNNEKLTKEFADAGKNFADTVSGIKIMNVMKESVYYYAESTADDMAEFKRIMSNLSKSADPMGDLQKASQLFNNVVNNGKTPSNKAVAKSISSPLGAISNAITSSGIYLGNRAATGATATTTARELSDKDKGGKKPPTNDNDEDKKEPPTNDKDKGGKEPPTNDKDKGGNDKDKGGNGRNTNITTTINQSNTSTRINQSINAARQNMNINSGNVYNITINVQQIQQHQSIFQKISNATKIAFTKIGDFYNSHKELCNIGLISAVLAIVCATGLIGGGLFAGAKAVALAGSSQVFNQASRMLLSKQWLAFADKHGTSMHSLAQYLGMQNHGKGSDPQLIKAVQIMADQSGITKGSPVDIATAYCKNYKENGLLLTAGMTVVNNWSWSWSTIAAFFSQYWPAFALLGAISIGIWAFGRKMLEAASKKGKNIWKVLNTPL